MVVSNCGFVVLEKNTFEHFFHIFHSELKAPHRPQVWSWCHGVNNSESSININFKVNIGFTDAIILEKIGAKNSNSFIFNVCNALLKLYSNEQPKSESVV